MESIKEEHEGIMRNKWHTLRTFLQERAIKRGDFTLRSGKKSDWYLDTRQVTLNHDCAQLVGALVAEMIRKLYSDTDYVGGMELGACPIVSAVVHEGYEGFYVRKETKAHGVSSRIVGNVKFGGKTVLLEDVLTTGGSAEDALGVCAAFGLQVSGVIALVDRCEDGTAFKALSGIATTSIYTKGDLI
jgi:orotate phosphoribosyltransferase